MSSCTGPVEYQEYDFKGFNVEMKITTEIELGEEGDYTTPGVPDCLNPVEVTCLRATGENWQYKRDERPDWFRFLDSFIETYLMDEIFETINYDLHTD